MEEENVLKGVYGFKSNWSLIAVGLEVVFALIIFGWVGMWNQGMLSVGYGIGFGLVLPFVNRLLKIGQ